MGLPFASSCRPPGPAVVGLLLVLGAGCSGSSGGADLPGPKDAAMGPHPRDLSTDRYDGSERDAAVPDAAGPPPDAAGGFLDLATNPDLAPTPVTGTVIDTYLQTSISPLMVPRNIAGASIAVLVSNGMGGYVTYPGTGLANGTFSIPGVPQGPYYLKFDNTYVLTDLRGVNLGGTFLGRPTAVAATKSTPLVFNVTSLHPWQPSDILQFFCGGVDAYISSVDSFAPALTAASTALSNLTVDYFAASVPPNLIDGTQGDVAYLTQLATTTTSTATYQSLSRLFQPASFTQTNGGTTTLTGAFGGVTQNLSVVFDWKLSQFYGDLAAVNPAAIANGQTIAISAQPAGLALAGSANAPDLLVVTEPTLLTDLVTPTLTYGNAFPTQWELAASASASFIVQYALPGTTALNAPGAIYYNEDLATFSANPVQPLISPPQALAINGKNAAVAQSGVTTTPLLTWTAPAAGTVNAYQVTVYQLTKSGTNTVQTALAVFYTGDRSVTLPSGILQAGGSYYIAVRALAQPGLNVSAEPFAVSVPNGGADALTGILTP